MTAAERATRFCYVSIRGRRGFVLENFIMAERQYVEGRMKDGEKVRIRLQAGVKVTALASDCEGDLTDFAHSCHCNSSQARVHDVAQQPPKPVGSPVAMLGAVKSFAQLGQILGGR